MTTERSGGVSPPPERRNDGDVPLGVHSCSRIGLHANPPVRRVTIAGWLRAR